MAKNLGISEGWLNNQVASLGTRLGKGWKSKCSVIYKGKAVTLKCISRQDLINLKLHATVARKGKDYEDILWLKPTRKELQIAKDYTLKQDDADTFAVFVNGYVAEIMKDLGI